MRAEKFTRFAELVSGSLSAEVNDVMVKYKEPGVTEGKYAWEASGELDPIKVMGTLRNGPSTWASTSR